ncbi:hypothetical protein O9H85_04010 [Paenibacillus filicis]|uniref:Uncharacterized protein n=1 Tax=Paenibacillus gyeongsangnamensis TaxID=3388067 RepID=A0ABT4Q405_9BACL|nr:hypothetical protein [Paenibacillus filicis]MCZ8511610.1 hypothetical protein [Paenibacillus filicis]
MIDILGTEADDVVEKVQLKIEKSKIYKNLDILDEREKGTGDQSLVCVTDRKAGAHEAVS